MLCSFFFFDLRWIFNWKNSLKNDNSIYSLEYPNPNKKTNNQTKLAQQLKKMYFFLNYQNLCEILKRNHRFSKFRTDTYPTLPYTGARLSTWKCRKISHFVDRLATLNQIPYFPANETHFFPLKNTCAPSKTNVSQRPGSSKLGRSPN